MFVYHASMKLSMFLAVATVALMMAGGALAIGVPPVDERGENRQILLGMEGTYYNPSALVHVLSGPPADFMDVVVPASEALEMHLDQLEQHGVRLADLLTATTSADAPEWPLAGHVQFHEKGWYQMGARCVHVEPEQESTIEELFDTVLPGADDRLGLMTTDVSEYPTNEFGNTVQSALQYWTVDQDPATQDPTNTWWYTGWTIEAGFLIDYFCREPTASKGLVFQDSFVTPYTDRVDV